MNGFTPDELRMIGVGGPLWLRLLKAREERIVNKIYGEFKNNKTDQLLNIAELACVRDQINEITAALKQNAQQKE